MPAPTIGHVICTMGLIALIFVMPFFYATVANNIKAEMMKRELKEISDYVSNAVENLYFLVNSTRSLDVSLNKELIYLPSAVENFIYNLKIVESGGSASKIAAYLKDKPSTVADAWLAPGLRVGSQNYVESGGRTVVVGCSRNATGVYVWIGYS